jgi:hypothetical protein
MPGIWNIGDVITEGITTRRDTKDLTHTWKQGIKIAGNAMKAIE